MRPGRLGLALLGAAEPSLASAGGGVVTVCQARDALLLERARLAARLDAPAPPGAEAPPSAADFARLEGLGAEELKGRYGDPRMTALQDRLDALRPLAEERGCPPPDLERTAEDLLRQGRAP
ncbi:hypothetical protein [Parvularcula dongshanensis]|uniref:Uncharacterized protein n=1 Tax=Parvularcula dongshanensis TaxID=1173995 RepID=A0A840I0I7_9PROT|nr:hypothetical protein [Parvularcula dongshanensis]MBB4657855.1 hypothetical protein [Parvularcula dongshanensis]